MHTHAHTHARTHTHTCTHARTLTHARTYAHSRTHAHTHTHTHTTSSPLIQQSSNSRANSENGAFNALYWSVPRVQRRRLLQGKSFGSCSVCILAPSSAKPRRYNKIDDAPLWNPCGQCHTRQRGGGCRNHFVFAMKCRQPCFQIKWRLAKYAQSINSRVNKTRLFGKWSITASPNIHTRYHQLVIIIIIVESN